MARDTQGRFVKADGSAPVKSRKKACPDCTWQPGLKDQETLCPTCKGSGKV